MIFCLASSSTTRLTLLRAAGLAVEPHPARVDEVAIRAALVADTSTPKDIADTLAEAKARKVSGRLPDQVVLGFDQTLALGGQVLTKVDTRAEAIDQLRSLSGQTHHLYSAAVIYEEGRPIWRHVGSARMSMHPLSPDEINAYLDLAWPDVATSVGCYHAEGLGAQLFSRIDGDWFSVLGVPLLPMLSYFRTRGWLAR